MTENLTPETLRKDAALTRMWLAGWVEPYASAWEADRRRLEALVAAVNNQVEDEGLWFIAETAPEAYLQNALRLLHALVEGDDFMAALAAGEEKS